MKKILILLFSVCMIISFSACSKKVDPNALKVIHSSDDLVGENYQTVISELQTIGFTNIKTELLDDLIIGWLTKDGEIEKIEINGKTDFNANASFSKDAKIVITYHTFPNPHMLATNEIVGENYEIVITKLKDKGFTNIETKVLEDLILGGPKKDGEIQQVEISGKTEFSANDSYPKDTKIVITYHTFTKDELAEIAKFPKEYAMRAAVVAFTNRFATDVFKPDGNTYDISKFHSYADVSGELMIVNNEGSLSVKNKNTWHVEHLKLTLNDVKTTIDATLDVSYDGKNYIVSNLTGTAPSYPDIRDLEKESDFSTFFIVPPKLVKDNRVAPKELKEEVAMKAFEYYGEALYPYGFKCHWWTGLEIHEQSYDGSWHFKVGVTVTNKYGASREATAEGDINNTTESVENFSVY